MTLFFVSWSVSRRSKKYVARSLGDSAPDNYITQSGIVRVWVESGDAMSAVKEARRWYDERA